MNNTDHRRFFTSKKKKNPRPFSIPTFFPIISLCPKYCCKPKSLSRPFDPEIILRPRLIKQLQKELHRKLTLITAPAGFGKTTLVSTWIQQDKRPTTWLSLDENDNDLAQFFIYLIAALQQIDKDIGVDIQAALQASQTPPPVEHFLTTLVNEIATATKAFGRLGANPQENQTLRAQNKTLSWFSMTITS